MNFGGSNARMYASASGMNVNFSTRSLPAPVPVAGSFGSQLSAGHFHHSSHQIMASTPAFDPTVEQLFPPGVIADIERQLSKNVDDGMIGLEYIIEVRHNTVKKVPHTFACLLCNTSTKFSKDMDSSKMIMIHIKSIAHKTKYIDKFFPTVKAKATGPLKIIDHDVVNSVSLKINQFYGKVSVKVVVGQKLFKKKSAEIKTMIDNSTHFRENDEFLRLLFGTDFSSSKSKKEASPRRSRSPSPSSHKRYDSRKDNFECRKERSRSTSNSRKMDEGSMPYRSISKRNERSPHEHYDNIRRPSSPRDHYSKRGRSGSPREHYSKRRRSESPREPYSRSIKSGSHREHYSRSEKLVSSVGQPYNRGSSGSPREQISKSYKSSSPKDRYSEAGRPPVTRQCYTETRRSVSPRVHYFEPTRSGSSREHHFEPRRSGSPKDNYFRPRRPGSPREHYSETYRSGSPREQSFETKSGINREYFSETRRYSENYSEARSCTPREYSETFRRSVTPREGNFEARRSCTPKKHNSDSKRSDIPSESLSLSRRSMSGERMSSTTEEKPKSQKNSFYSKEEGSTSLPSSSKSSNNISTFNHGKDNEFCGGPSQRFQEASRNTYHQEPDFKNIQKDVKSSTTSNPEQEKRDLDQRIDEFLRLTETHKRELSDEIYHYVKNPGNHEEHANEWLKFYDAKCKQHLKRVNPALLQEEWKAEWGNFLEYVADTKYRRYKEKLLQKLDIYIRDVDLFLQKRHQKEKSQEKVPQNLEESEPTVYGTCRLLVAIEEFLGDSGTELLQYLPRAKDLESKRAGRSCQLLENSSFHQLFISIKATLQAKLDTATMADKNTEIFERCLREINFLLKQARIDEPTSPQKQFDSTNADLTLLNMIRQTISDECFRSGRSVTKEHLEELVQSEYMRVRHVPKVPEVQGRKNQDSESEPCQGSSNQKTNSPNIPTEDHKSSNDTKSQMEDLSIDELGSLLKNFQALDTSVQNKLICYMKKLEEQNPKMIEILRKQINIS